MTPLVAALLATTAHAWTADEPWRTVETAHYRIHYPLDTEAWALDLAARIDPMRERVAEVVGWAPDHPNHIVVLDPWSNANGFALPFARAPRIGVFPTAAPASSGIGNYRLWSEDLLVHEDAHVLHLARPSRNPMERFVFDGLLGVPAIAVKSPAWVVEGYATLVEGILTGAGRPNSDGRATFLRMLAAEGQLPTYAQLDGSSRWRGRSMRYLVGSAYLEWLAAEFGDERLPELWARMTARKRRTFSEAFEGTFGAPPAELYGRFVAEMSAGALAVEPPEDGAERFLDLSGEVEPPAVSPDGTRIATVEKGDSGGYKLVVRTVSVDQEAVQERAEAVAELLEKDPTDVASVDPDVPPRERVATFHSPLLRPRTPRWIDDDRLLFTAWVADSHGVFQPDLFEWSTESGRTRRLTRQANLREAEPCGDRAIAVRRQHGLSSLVSVDLASGDVTSLTAARPTVVEASPRVDTTCTTVAWLRHEETWQLMVAPIDAMAGGEPEASWHITLPAHGQLLSADLHPDGQAITAAVGTEGTIDLWTRPLHEGTWTRRTTRIGGAFDPEVTAQGDTYFLTTDPRGFDVLHLPADAPDAPDFSPPEAPYTRAVVRPPPVSDAPALPTGTAPEPAPYGLGPQLVRAVVDAQASRAVMAADVGVSVGDLVGRSELLVLAGTVEAARPEHAPEPPVLDLLGARAVWTHRRFAVHTTLDAWWLGFSDHALGGGASGHLHRRWATGRVDARLGAFGETSDLGADLASTGRFHLASWTAFGPLVGGATLDGQGRLGVAEGSPTLGDGTLRVHLGQKVWAVEASGRWAAAQEGPLLMGDVAPALLPEVRSIGTLWWPSLSGSLPTVVEGVRHTRADLRFADRAVGLFGELAWLDCPADTCDAPDRASALGIDARIGTGAQPIATIPGVSFTGGLSCQTTGPDGTFDITSCGSFDAYAAWLSVRMTPGSPPAYPHRPE